MIQNNITRENLLKLESLLYSPHYITPVYYHLGNRSMSIVVQLIVVRTYHMHGQDMSYTCHQLIHVTCMLHVYNMHLPCMCHTCTCMHIGENDNSYEDVVTSELIHII